ncbi:MAG: hypothetical protein EBR82_67250 [Caulobacteraceae bacterium]|nr:hypothetical protein [Caulobacteraceae bacterium]
MNIGQFVDPADYYEWAAEFIASTGNYQRIERRHAELTIGSLEARVWYLPADTWDAIRNDPIAFVDRCNDYSYGYTMRGEQ